MRSVCRRNTLKSTKDCHELFLLGAKRLVHLSNQRFFFLRPGTLLDVGSQVALVAITALFPRTVVVQLGRDMRPVTRHVFSKGVGLDDLDQRHVLLYFGVKRTKCKTTSS